MADPIDLNSLANVTPLRIAYESDTITTIVSAGKTVQLRTGLPVAVLASGVVPDGKQWEIQWVMCITETVEEEE